MSKPQLYLAVLFLAITSLVCLLGCDHEEAPVSPNALTAAPARLPGEDPHKGPVRTAGVTPPAGLK